MVLKTLKDNGLKAKQILLTAVPMIAAEDWTQTLQQNKVDFLQLWEQIIIIIKMTVSVQIKCWPFNAHHSTFYMIQ